jgi:hypothetical protein
MSKFKAGDSVVCVESSGNQVINGEAYSVVGVTDSDCIIVHRSDTHEVGGYHYSRFKLKEEPQPLTWNMEEIGKVLDNYFDFKDGSSVDFILRELVEMKHKQDPEYPKYLELKKKFEGS